MSESIPTDGMIRRALQRKDDPEHPSSYSLADIREAFDAVQAELFEYLEELDETHGTPVYEDRAVIVYADPTGDELGLAIEELGLDDEHGIMGDVLDVLMHEIARDRAEYDWSASWPVVIVKPIDFQRGESHAMARIAGLIDESDGAARGIDRWATEVMGLSSREWGDERWTDRNHTGISKNTRRGREAAESK